MHLKYCSYNVNLQWKNTMPNFWCELIIVHFHRHMVTVDVMHRESIGGSAWARRPFAAFFGFHYHQLRSQRLPNTIHFFISWILCKFLAMALSTSVSIIFVFMFIASCIASYGYAVGDETSPMCWKGGVSLKRLNLLFLGSLFFVCKLLAVI